MKMLTSIRLPGYLFLPMLRLFILLFGLVGFCIACLQGIEPFIEFTFWVAWVSENWLAWSRMFWNWVGSLVGISVPKSVSDSLSGAVYTFGLFAGYRRTSQALVKTVAMFAFKLDGYSERLIKNIPVWLGKVISVAVGLVIFSPWIIVLILLLLGSPVQAGVVLFLCLLIEKIPGYFPTYGPRVIKFLTGRVDRELQVFDVGEEDIVPLVYLVTPVVIIFLVFFVLVTNEVAANGTNILAFYDWAKCEAEIRCREN